jgi:hypothetical protein
MTPEYQIGALWMGGNLSFLEQLCLISFRDAGHHVKLYTYEEVGNIPDGIEIADANTIQPTESILRHAKTGSPAPQADKFRYQMLATEDRIIWADTDAYCVKPFETANGHFYGWESKTHINNGVVGLPQDSDTLRELIDFTHVEYPIPDWFPEEEKAQLRTAHEAGEPVHVSEFSWGLWGPQALTHFLHKTGEVKYALPVHALYPFSFKERRLMLRRGIDLDQYIKPDTYSVHFYGRRMRKRIVEREGGAPKRFSLIGKLLHQHGVNPEDAPIPYTPPPGTDAPVKEYAPLVPSDRYGRGVLNLTDIADKYALDQGNTKHRFTELYHLLFLPYRNRAIQFAALGVSEAAAGEELPAIRMWLEYFTKAQISGIDVADHSGFSDDRFQFTQVDLDDRSAVAEMAAAQPAPDIVLDDATHASHHQQIAFVEMFARLKPGGMYLIEDLRWQPSSLERDDWPKTADLFQGYLDQGYFAHPNPDMAEALNALRADFSGCFLHQAHYRKKNRDQVLVVHKR